MISYKENISRLEHLYVHIYAHNINSNMLLHNFSQISQSKKSYQDVKVFIIYFSIFDRSGALYHHINLLPDLFIYLIF